MFTIEASSCREEWEFQALVFFSLFAAYNLFWQSNRIVFAVNVCYLFLSALVLSEERCIIPDSKRNAPTAMILVRLEMHLLHFGNYLLLETNMYEMRDESCVSRKHITIFLFVSLCFSFHHTSPGLFSSLLYSSF
ncbi:hypothetical protein J3F83DRAFT_394559 [Trichoderma novae-zelandiae]